MNKKFYSFKKTFLEFTNQKRVLFILAALTATILVATSTSCEKTETPKPELPEQPKPVVIDTFTYNVTSIQYLIENILAMEANTGTLDAKKRVILISGNIEYSPENPTHTNAVERFLAVKKNGKNIMSSSGILTLSPINDGDLITFANWEKTDFAPIVLNSKGESFRCIRWNCNAFWTGACRATCWN